MSTREVLQSTVVSDEKLKITYLVDHIIKSRLYKIFYTHRLHGTTSQNNRSGLFDNLFKTGIWIEKHEFDSTTSRLIYVENDSSLEVGLTSYFDELFDDH